ncbi:MAG: B12-binding domain-containing radical SAM protein [Promethearchaeota archaeon]
MTKRRSFVLIDSYFGQVHEKNLPTQSCLSVGTYLEKRYPELDLELFDLRFERRAWRRGGDLKEAIASADAVGISCSFSGFYTNAIKVAERCRKLAPKVPILVGGHHASVVPGDFLKFPELFDFVVRGPAEVALDGIVANLHRTGFKRPKSPVLVKNPPLSDASAMLFPDWSLYGKYFARDDVTPVVFVKFSQGCDNWCRFCSNSGPYRRKFVQVSPKEGVERIRQTLAFVESACPPGKEPVDHLRGGTELRVFDEMFGTSAEWRHKFLERLVDARPTLPIEDFDLYVDQRIDDFSLEDMKLFDRARANVAFGVESFDGGMLATMGKTLHPKEYLRNAKRLLVDPPYERRNTYYSLLMLFGFPSESPESLESTKGAFEEVEAGSGGPVGLNLSIFGLMPGTDVFIRRGYYEEKFGSRFHFPGWWRERDAFVKSMLNDPGEELSLFGLFDWFKENLVDIIDGLVERARRSAGPLKFLDFMEDYKKIITRGDILEVKARELLNRVQVPVGSRVRGEVPG